jgi:hypothetical protein
LLSGQPFIDVTATQQQIEQINQQLHPWPNYQQDPDGSGRKYINTDSPSTNPQMPRPLDTASYQFQGPLPTVKTFCRYLVILGTVMASIWMGKAAWGMCNGHPYAGNRAVATITGLMMLLCAYTIWKIVQMNTFMQTAANQGLTAPVNTAVANNGMTMQSGQGTVNNLQQPNLPVVPQTPNTPARSPLPVAPLNGN